MKTIAPALGESEPCNASDPGRPHSREHKAKQACRLFRNELILRDRAGSMLAGGCCRDS